MPPLNNELIRASAGSGKTYALVRRYIRLLARGENPEQIAALTFTRKAAGEFFERIFQTLAMLATDTTRTQGYVEELPPLPESRPMVLKILRSLVSSMDRLRMGTIDSFFASMVQCAPFELGLAGQASIMAPEEVTEAHEEVLDLLMLQLTRNGDSPELREMMEAWKRATFGKEQNRVTESLLDWLKKYHDWLVEYPEQRQWGGESLIWPDPGAAIHRANIDLAAAIRRLRDTLPWEAYKKANVKAVPKWEGDLEEILSPGVLDYWVDSKRGDPRRLRSGEGSWMVYRTVPLDAAAGNALMDLLEMLVGRELKTRCERTAGRYFLLQRFEALYRERVRSRGRLSFSELTGMLSGDLPPLGVQDAAAWREQWFHTFRNVQFRLDSGFRHWLFDEFQDTNFRQWSVVSNLVDEAAQDRETGRSFFAVGDLKQSIYLWREAEPQLFLDVEDQYRNVRLDLPKLNESYRSCPEVLGMVNAVFSRQDILRDTLPGAMRWWEFEEHQPSERQRKFHGHAALLSLEEQEEEDEDVKPLNRLLLALLKEIRPIERGLTCAVLVRRNKVAAELAAFLRQELDWEVLCDSEEAIATDNAVNLALLSVLQVAAHPDDAFSWEHLLMTPLSRWIEGEAPSKLQGDLLTAGNPKSEIRNPKSALGGSVRRQLAHEGFLPLLRTWAQRIQDCQGAPFDRFSEWRLGQLFDLASTFDATGRRDLDAFLTFAKGYRLRTHRQSGALHVMTIHKSKGLEFDVLILAELQGSAKDRGMDDISKQDVIKGSNDRKKKGWVLEKPVKEISEWAGLPEDDPLPAAIESTRARTAYESLCRLYVGMTRAKLGLYALIPTYQKAKSGHESRLLLDTLVPTTPLAGPSVELPPKAPSNPKSEIRNPKSPFPNSQSYPLGATSAQCWYQLGRQDWYLRSKATAHEQSAIRNPKSAIRDEPLGEMLRRLVKPIRRRTPSGEEEFQITGRDLLSPRRQTARHQGILVHLLFSHIRWLDDLPPGGLEAVWSANGVTQFQISNFKFQISRNLDNPDIRPWFIRGDRLREAWMEKPFDLLLKGQWVSGVLDRVVLEQAPSGAWTSATILDFKTDEVAPGHAALFERSQSYAPQLSLYSQAVSRLTGLPPSAIRTALVFTSVSQLHWLALQ